MNPMQVVGPWDEGYVLDKYVASSEYIGEDVFGHPAFNTTYTEIGKLLHSMKYNGHLDTSERIWEHCSLFLKRWIDGKDIDIILPVPPTNQRYFQPVFAFSEVLAQHLKIPFSSEVLEKTSWEQAKNMPRENKNLKGSIRQLKPAKRLCNILLVDDFFSTGQTASECVSVLKQDPMIQHIFFLAIAKTK